VPGLKPLIRYRTGDLVDIVPDTSGRRTVTVLGRVKDMVEIGGRKRSAAEIDNAVLADPELVYGYDIDVGSSGGQDRLHVRVKAKEGADHDQLRALVAGRLSAAFGVPAEATIHPLLDLKSATGGWVSWKTARIKDLRTQQPDDIEARSAAQLARAVERAI
jgi:phenylacetate-CoA ligase